MATYFGGTFSNSTTTPRQRYIGAAVVEAKQLIVQDSIIINSVPVTSEQIVNTVVAPNPKLPPESGYVLTGKTDGTTQWTSPIDLVGYDQTFHGSKTFDPGVGVGMLFSIAPTLVTPDSVYIQFHIQGFDNGSGPFSVRTDQYAVNSSGSWTIQNIGAGYIFPGPTNPVSFIIIGTQIICTLALHPTQQRRVTWHLNVDTHSNQHVTYTPL